MSASPALFGVDFRILLEVGERRFTTSANTLTGQSAFFAALLSNIWDNVQPGKHYFIDIDGDVFAHVLRYLRSGVFPVFYDKSKGHDYNLYAMLLEQARYLQISRLEKWLEGKSYLQAITVTRSVTEVELKDMIAEKTATDVDVEYRSDLRTRKVYICPRDILSHRGQPEKCGRRCDNAQGDCCERYDNENFVVVSITRTKIEFNQEVCMKGGRA